MNAPAQPNHPMPINVKYGPSPLGATIAIMRELQWCEESMRRMRDGEAFYALDSGANIRPGRVVRQIAEPTAVSEALLRLVQLDTPALMITRDVDT